MLQIALALLATAAPAAARPALAAAARSFSPRVLGTRDALARQTTLSTSPAPSVVVVTDFGAVGDGTTDNAAAFARAVAALPAGGIVFVPAGQYSFAAASVSACAAGVNVTASICLTPGVSLVGTYETVPSHDLRSGPLAIDGSQLLPRAGRGDEAGAVFLFMPPDTTLRGFTIFYPEVLPKEAPPPYPFTIEMKGNNVAVQDVELLNSYNGISAVGAHRHYISRVQGQPTNVGILVDQTYDIGRIEDVHFNPWFSDNATYIAHQTTFGTGFQIARSDWEVSRPPALSSASRHARATCPSRSPHE
jgi:hypothetical protein